MTEGKKIKDNQNKDIRNDEGLLIKNRIGYIEEEGRTAHSIKKPMIIVSTLVAVTIITIMIAVKFYYKKPAIFKASSKDLQVPFDKISKDIENGSENIRIKRGIESYSKGYLNDAIKEFNEVVESDAPDKDKATALMYMGMINDDRGSYDKAIGLYSRALVYDKDNPQIYKNLSLAYRHKKKYKEAIENAKKSIALNPEDLNTLTLLGNIYFETGNYNEAIKQYNRALEISPGNPPVLYNLASALMKKGDEFAAVEYFKKAGASDKIGEVAHRAYSRLGVLYTERNDLPAAIKYLKEAVSIRPNDPVNSYNLGIAYLKQNEKDKALELLSKAEKYGEKDSQMLQNIGEAYFSLKDYNRSLALYNKILSVNKRNIRILSRIAEIYYKKGELDRAYENYRKITLIEPATENARIAYLNMGNILDDSLKYDEAIKAYQKALSISPKDSSAYFNIGIAYKHAGKPEKAINSWKESIRLDPENPKSYIAIADYYYEKKFYDLAEKEYGKILIRWPQLQDAHFKIATIYYKKDQLDYALRSYKKVLKINENNELARKAYVNIAIITSKLNNDEKSLNRSIQLIRKALLLKPGDSGALLSMGIIYLKKEMYDRAIDTFYQAIKSSNDSKIIAESYNNIGKSYYKKGLYKKALQSFTRGIEEDPSNEQIRMNRKAAMQAYESELAGER